MSAPTTTSLLTHSKSVWSAKKKWKTQQVQEVVFDEDARREFLTGFRKRKMAKKQEKVDRAKERERLGRLADRAERRKALRARALENFKAVETALGGTVLPDALGLGLDGNDGRPAEDEEREEAYEGEEMFASVTVVEDFDPASILDDDRPAAQPLEDDLPAPALPKPVKKPVPKEQKPKPKPKTKTFRYETKAARKTARDKEQRRRKQKGGEREGRAGKGRRK